MKTMKKILTLSLALMMVLSCMAPAGAAMDPMNRISDHAGTTRPVLVVEDNGTSVQEHMLNVAIPANATKAEELALIQSSAKQSAGLPVTRGTPTLGDVISVKDNISIAASPAIIVGEGKLGNNYDVLAVTFDNVKTRNSATRLNVRIDNNRHYDNTYGSASIRLGTYTLVYLRTNGSGSSQGGDDLILNSGDYITVWSSTDRGGVDVGTVYVSAE